MTLWYNHLTSVHTHIHVSMKWASQRESALHVHCDIIATWEDTQTSWVHWWINEWRGGVTRFSEALKYYKRYAPLIFPNQLSTLRIGDKMWPSAETRPVWLISLLFSDLTTNNVLCKFSITKVSRLFFKNLKCGLLSDHSHVYVCDYIFRTTCGWTHPHLWLNSQ